VLCRAALGGGLIGAGLFTAIRICSGAVVLLIIVRPPRLSFAGGILAASMLFAYAACFSFAYVALGAGTGALLLFGAVQVTMILGGLLWGERPGLRVWLGWALACAGLFYLVMPGLESPPVLQAIMMLGAGVAWGVYSLSGKRNTNPTAATMRNFVLATPLAVALYLCTTKLEGEPNLHGMTLAVVSGAITSGIGYVIWYSALRHISSTTAAVAQLTVPIIAAIGGIAFLGEVVSVRLALASVLTLGGVAMALYCPAKHNAEPE